MTALQISFWGLVASIAALALCYGAAIRLVVRALELSRVLRERAGVGRPSAISSSLDGDLPRAAR